MHSKTLHHTTRKHFYSLFVTLFKKIFAWDLTAVVDSNFVQQGADKNKARNDGETPLFTAAGNGNLAIVQYLVQRGAEINQADIYGATSFTIAAQQGHLAVVQYLVLSGADVNTSEGAAALAAATGMGHTAVANYLREQGAI